MFIDLAIGFIAFGIIAYIAAKLEISAEESK